MKLCPYCGDPIVPPKRLKCGDPECFRAYQNEKYLATRGPYVRGPIADPSFMGPRKSLRSKQVSGFLRRFDEASPDAIAELCGIDRNNAYQILSRLVRRGLAVRLGMGRYAPTGSQP